MTAAQDRILTTHVGSLPRDKAVTDLVFGREQGAAIDEAEFDRVIGAAVAEVVAKQVAAGIDLVSDGEQSKISYATYIKDRISGFEGDSPRIPPEGSGGVPELLERQAKGGGTPSYRRPMNVAETRPMTLEPLHQDVAHLKAALAPVSVEGAFMNAPSPGSSRCSSPPRTMPRRTNIWRRSPRRCGPEYEAVVAAGLILQLDSPDLGLGRHTLYKDREEGEYLSLAERHVEVINHALRNVPADRVRMHLCWGNYEGPHHCDIEMEALLPIVLKAKPRGLLFETSNPRHQHDWAAFVENRDAIPDDLVLIPGVIDTTTNFIEHPKVVAQRIETFANIVGRERVMAGTDCGFSTFAGFGAVDPDIVWAKLRTLSEGAAIATERLWRKAA
jgi:5-methyltetrahydropteroyltriglutamate--homocysteine methyltransferase